MGEIQTSLLGEVLTDIASGPSVSGHVELTKALMTRFAEKGLTLAQIADRRMMNRSQATLERYARQFGLQFPDYIPQALRPKKGPKKPKGPKVVHNG
jgi:hypothetical protein